MRFIFITFWDADIAEVKNNKNLTRRLIELASVKI